MKLPTAFAGLVEAVTGVALLAVPSMVGRLVFNTEVSGAVLPFARLAAIGLIGLGLACWPGKEASRSALCAILTYNLIIALYLLYLGIRGQWVGILLWPAVAYHAVLTLLLARSWLRSQKTEEQPPITPKQ